MEGRPGLLSAVMWWKAEASSLARVSDRISTVYVDQSVVGRNQNAVVLFDADGEIHVPAAMTAALLLGPGTRVTSGAMRLLADSGTTVCWVGENGVRMYAHAVSTAQTSRYMLRQAKLVSDPHKRLAVAREMYGMRFPGEDVSKMSLQQLRGREGVRVRRAYKLHSSRTGVPWEGRRYVPGQPYAAGDEVNRSLSALNACLYGVCHAATVGLGASAALGFVHSGSALSFVLDVADLYKAMTTIPTAFDLVQEGQIGEQNARLRFRQQVVEQDLMERVVDDIHTLLFGPEDRPAPEQEDQGDDEDQGVASLWDGDGLVPGGRNYAGAEPETEVDKTDTERAPVDYSELDDV